eukprot:GHVS01058835.1.p1 GENE.GHVS01058835.1~~GHVS01058835.1.p1  ORF type:complete len:255 (-),score=25.54 GHVS01058835.1:165-929(-)
MARKILWSWKIWILLIVVLQISQKTLRVSAVVKAPVLGVESPPEKSEVHSLSKTPVAADAEGVDVGLPRVSPDLNSADEVARQTKGVQSSEDIAESVLGKHIPKNDIPLSTAVNKFELPSRADFKHTMSEKPSDTYSLRFDPDNLSMVSYEVVPFDPVDTSAAAPGGEQQPQRETHDNPDKAGSAFSNEGESNPPPGKDASTVVGSPSPSVSHSQNGVQNGVPLKPTFLEKKPHELLHRRSEGANYISIMSYKP